MTPRGDSQFKSKKFQFLYRYPKRSRFWVYRRYSPEKDDQFDFSTGEESNEKLAFDIGEKAYHRWLGLEASQAKEGSITFERFGQEHLDRKLARPDSDFSPNSKRTSRNAIVNHLLPAFGKLRLDQVTEDRWEDYVSRSLNDNSKQKFFNRRKELLEILRRAHRLGFIQRLPEIRNPDPDTEVGQYLEDATVRKLLKHCESKQTELLIWILWKMGARPGEALQYSWDMIDWKKGKHGFIHIPAKITKTRRPRSIPLNPLVAKRLRTRQKRSKSSFLFPSPMDPARPMVEYKTGWEGACKRAGVQADVYDLRRTFISNQAKRGRAIVYVAKFCDTSVAMIERFYAKVNTEVMEQIAK